MGRHSAPDDSEEGTAAPAPGREDPSDARGRHEVPEPDVADSAPPDTADDPPGEDAAPPAQRERATQADLRLLREHPALRARCIAAALVPFVVYTVVLFALARVHIYVLWIWAPIIAAGILVGVMLDTAHKRLDARPPPSSTDSA